MSTPCGCCAAPAPLTPLAVANRPGLSAVAYRVGTYASFRQSMLEGISAAPPVLSALSTRDDDDPGIALLDLWATAADVLTFYGERDLNEALLRTATQRESVLDLAALLDYRPATGVSAQAQLVALLDEGRAETIPAGTRVQSATADAAPPQTFETSTAAACDWRLNALRVQAPPLPVDPFPAGATDVQLRLDAGPEGLAAVTPGARVLIFRDGEEGVEAKRVAAVDAIEERVVVTVAEPIVTATGADGRGVVAGRTMRLYGHAAPASFMVPSPTATGSERITWKLNSTSFAYPASGSPVESTTALCLDAVYAGLSAGGLLLVVDATGAATLVTIQAVDQVGDELAGLAGDCTRVTVAPVHATAMPALGDRRLVTVHEVLDGELAIAPQRSPAEITGAELALVGQAVTGDEGLPAVRVGARVTRDGFEDPVVLSPADLPTGRAVVLDDAAQRPTGGVLSAPTMIVAIDDGKGAALLLTVDRDDERPLDGATAVLHGNVVGATHGETVRDEVLGGGDATAAFQRFALLKAPLTYVPSAGPGGKRSTLSLRVNDVGWLETAVLFGRGPDEHVYETRADAAGSTIVQTGDGRGDMGGRPATGHGNVKATYRHGTGLAGRVPALSLTTLVDRPPGVAKVTNPEAATGGADPETTESARDAAPRTVRTFGRAVSLADFADLVRESGEVAKAQATWVWSGYERLIHLTVLGQAAGLFTEDDLRRLGVSLATQRDVNHPLRLANGVPVEVGAAATVTVAADQEHVVVETAARAAFDAWLAFDAVELGMPLHLSDLYHVLQDVEGVDHVLVTRLGFEQPAGMTNADFDALLTEHGVARRPDGSAEPVQARLRILPARPDPTVPGVVLPAELPVAGAADGAVELEVLGGLEG